MLRVELPTVSPCTGCGNCCRSIGLPPFEVPNPDLGPQKVERGDVYGEAQTAVMLADMATFAAMPAELRAAHARLVTELAADPSGTPCAWLDPETGGCRHYDHRPAVCREFVAGSDACLSLRPGKRQCVWIDYAAPEVWRNPRRAERYAKNLRYELTLTRWQRIRRWLRRHVASVSRKYSRDLEFPYVLSLHFFPLCVVRFYLWGVEVRGKRITSDSVEDFK